VFVGLIDANLGMVNAIVGELSNTSNQTAAFSFIPVFQGLGAILGVIAGGLLVFPAEKLSWLFGESEFLKEYPYSLQMSLVTVGFSYLTSSLQVYLDLSFSF
jgi:fucose permease